MVIQIGEPDEYDIGPLRRQRRLRRRLQWEEAREKLVERAVQALYERRKARQNHPEGQFMLNGWFPSERERCSCCEEIRAPSSAFPYPLMAHCRTVRHLRRLAVEKPAYFEELTGLTLLSVPEDD